MSPAPPEAAPAAAPATSPAAALAAAHVAREPMSAQEAIPGAVAEGAVLQRVATGFAFTEGPVWHPTEHWLAFSDIAASVQWRLRGAALEPLRLPSNQANGNCFDLHGRIVSCEHAASRLVVHDHDGKRVTPLATHHEGRALNSPNDVVCDREGRLWFTDPSFGRVRPDLGLVRAEEMAFRGVFRLDPDGTLEAVATDFEQPNGLCFTNDGRRLLVNDTARGHVRAFDADGGRLRGGAVWAEITGEGEGVPDGMKVDAEDRVWCNGPGGVHVLSPEGEALGVVRIPEKSTNFCFGGPARDHLHVTASTSVYRLPTLTTGAPMIHGVGPP